jgi:hypothetical protein
MQKPAGVCYDFRIAGGNKLQKFQDGNWIELQSINFSAKGNN